jgi:serine protease Do
MKERRFLRGFWLGVVACGLVFLCVVGGMALDRRYAWHWLDRWFPRSQQLNSNTTTDTGSFTAGEERTVNVVEHAKGSVVTVAIKQQIPQQPNQIVVSPFGLVPVPGQSASTIQRDIGTGFVVDKGLIVTNKHVVSDVNAEYKIVDADNKEYEVKKIYRDPVNDLAIIQTAAQLTVLPLADSDQLKVGQTVIAIGTALGEFRHTVTTGVISGLGRGIDAGTGFSQSEHIDNLIQTDAAINPGNSGGPLLNSQGQVIGVNVAVAQAQSIGFAIPINVIKDSITNFNATGQFDRPFLGVQYKIIPKETAVLNDVPEGAYVISVIPQTTAETMGVKVNDIITSVDGTVVRDLKGGLAGSINQKRIGEGVTVEVWRAGQKVTLPGKLQAAP